MKTIKKIAIYEDRATGTFVERYQLKKFDGGVATIDLPPSLATDGKSLRARLLDAGTVLASDLPKLSELAGAASKTKPDEHFVYEAQTGWLDGHKGFVTQAGSIGETEDKIIGIKPPTTDTRGITGSAGKSSEWSRSVAKLAEASSTLILTIATALAAPLMKEMGEDTFGLCLFGRTRGGKTLATLAAGSVIGFGKSERLLNWYSTTAGLEPYFHAFNDCVFPIDDLSKLIAKTDSDRYSEVRDLAYKAIGGEIKGRHPSFANAPGINSAHYRFIVLTSYEMSIRELAHRCNQARMGGEMMRLIDVPAYFDGLDHIFDRSHNTSSLTQKELQKYFEEVRLACDQNHGQVYRRYLRYLISHRAELKKSALRFQRFFGKKSAKGGDNNESSDLARKFGLIYAGGRLGIEAKVLPWRKNDLLTAILKCYAGARALLFGDEQLLTRGRAALRAHLMSLPKLSSLDDDEFAGSTGFVKPDGDLYRCTLRSEAFAGLFENRHQQLLVMTELLQMKQITLAKPKKHQKPRPQDQFKWPDGNRVRSYEILWGRKIPNDE
jgi:hypothetical protein